MGTTRAAQKRLIDADDEHFKDLLIWEVLRPRTPTIIMPVPPTSSYSAPYTARSYSALPSTAPISSQPSQPDRSTASSQHRYRGPSNHPSQTAAYGTHNRQSANHTTSRLFSRNTRDQDFTDRYGAAQERLENQLFDVANAVASSDVNCSDNVIESIQKLGEIARGYGQDNYIKKNMEDVVESLHSMGSAEKAARALLHSLQDLLVPSARLARGVFTTPHFESQAMAADAVPRLISSRRQPTTESRDNYHNGTSMHSMTSGGAERASRAIPTKSASWPVPSAVPVVHPLLAAYTDLAVTDHVLRRERASQDDPTSRSAAVRIERARVVDRLIETTAYNADCSRDEHVLQLCDKLLQHAKEGLESLQDQGTNLYRSSNAWESFQSSVYQNAETLHAVMAMAATIASAFAQNMDNSAYKVVLGGVGGALQAGVDYLARTTIGPSPTNTLSAVSNTLHTIEDLRYHAQLLLLSYVELQEIVRRILELRQESNISSTEEKGRIAQFFYSFGRHFDTMTGKSVEMACEQEKRKVADSRRTMFPEFDQVGLLSGAASATDRHYFCLVLLIWDAYERRELPEFVSNATQCIGNYLILAGSAIQALRQVFLAIQNVIRCSDENLDDTFLHLASASTSLTDAFDALRNSSNDALATLSALEREALAALSYPSFIHYAIVHFLGAQWTDRQYALAKVTFFVARVEQDLSRIASLAVELRVAVEGIREQFNVSKLLEIRRLGKERDQVSRLLARSSQPVSKWANHVSFLGKYILGFDEPMLKRSFANHGRPE
ncbi:hypothetical protein BD626DRAFT_575207 [Schizophyllum amplum]|uniref:Uncharacterized protein n=1 Tax=Schizophyllum amplum TaxID=97359 RepID=A0A550BWB6_9AGAR|nr:hypothetical protein BD626DRAFT_575207 [Auriculariopsis ampla]